MLFRSSLRHEVDSHDNVARRKGLYLGISALSESVRDYVPKKQVQFNGKLGVGGYLVLAWKTGI